ncbi:Hypothetical protein CulFRC58_1704 [Corynebacterium ulcerans FRC58]|uniref:Uncharacterized protein n=1 Tax=Corynebacterium ulcerans FRC58 TaxID=1408268 RepID=A0ABN4H1Q7_CORUL|nr:Hypothetical protein CulFRC58_1704 [Corynebacterium ulcerans FRC58]
MVENPLLTAPSPSLGVLFNSFLVSPSATLIVCFTSTRG